jgi:ketosteroid isomerase-like protein
MTTRHVRLALALFGAGVLVACRTTEQVPSDERAAIADSLRALVTGAYDFSSPDATARLLSLYPDSGRVISAAAGSVTTTRAALAAEISGFWQRVGRNMQEPSFVLGSSYVDVITRDAAVMTFTYSIPHRTPAGMPHTVSGAWTALWRRQGGRWTIVQEHLSDAPEAPATTATPEPRADSAAAPPMAHRH